MMSKTCFEISQQYSNCEIDAIGKRAMLLHKTTLGVSESSDGEIIRTENTHVVKSYVPMGLAIRHEFSTYVTKLYNF